MSWTVYPMIGQNGAATYFAAAATDSVRCYSDAALTVGTSVYIRLNVTIFGTVGKYGSGLFNSGSALSPVSTTAFAGTPTSHTSIAGFTLYKPDYTSTVYHTVPSSPTTVYSRSAVTESSAKGTVSTSGSSNSYDGNFTAAATAKTGYVFDRWVNVSGGATYSYDSSVTVPTTEAADIAIKALFTQTYFTLSVSGGTGGTATSDPSAGSVEAGSTVTLSAESVWGYDFSSWVCGGVSSSSSNPYVFSMPSSNVTASASFSSWPKGDLAITRIGEVTSNDVTYWRKRTGENDYVENTSASDQTTSVYLDVPVTLRASVTDPTLTYFVGWYTDAAGTSLYSADAEIAITPSASTVIYPKYAVTSSHTIVVRACDDPTYTSPNDAEDAGCSVSVLTPPNTGDDKYLTGTSVTLAAVAGASWTLTGWRVEYGGGGAATLSPSNPLTVAIGDDLTITAVFAVNQYTVTLSVDAASAAAGAGTVALKYTDGGGSDISLTNPDTVDYGFTVKAIATANSGFTFDGWYKNGVKIIDAGGSYYFTVVESVGLVAKFSVAICVAVNLGTGAEGVVYKSDAVGETPPVVLQPYAARYNPDGSLNQSFAPVFDNLVVSAAVQTDKKILVGGTFNKIDGYDSRFVGRLNTDGTADTSFLQTANGPVSAIAVQSDGKVIIGGSFTSVGGSVRNRIARLSGADATLDASFDPNANNHVYALAVQEDGKILVGGYFTEIAGVSKSYIARLNADGTLDAGFLCTVDNYVYTIAVQTDGKILIGGRFSNVSGASREKIARLNVDGTIDTTFNPSASAAVAFIKVDSAQRIVLCGSFLTVGGVARTYIARLDRDGNVDTEFDPSPNGEVYSFDLQSDDSVVFAGNFTTAFGQTATRVCKALSGGQIDASFSVSADNNVFKVAVDGDDNIFICGQFLNVGGYITVTEGATIDAVLGSTFYLTHKILNEATAFRGYYDVDTGLQLFTDQTSDSVEVVVEAAADIEARFDTSTEYVYLRMTNDPDGVENTGLGILSATGFVAELTETEFEDEVGWTPGTLASDARNRYYKFNRNAVTQLAVTPLTDRLFVYWTYRTMTTSGGYLELGAESEFSSLNPAPFRVYADLSVRAVWVSGVPVRVAAMYATGSDTTTGTIELSPVGFNRQTLPVGTIAEFVASDLVAMTATPANGYVFDGWYSDASATTLVDAELTHYETDLVSAVTLYAKFSQDEDAVYVWEGGSAPKYMTWRSKRLAASVPFDPSCVRVFADGYPVLLKIYACSSPNVPSPSTPTKQVYLNSERAVRLPTARKEKYFEIEVSSSFQILEVVMSTSMGGLSQ